MFFPVSVWLSASKEKLLKLSKNNKDSAANTLLMSCTYCKKLEHGEHGQYFVKYVVKQECDVTPKVTASCTKILLS